MITAFLSYSHRDKDIALYIARELRAREGDIFIDEEGLRPGNYWEQLGREIRGREVFIVLLSPESVKSKWVLKEISWAFMSKPEDKIIPLMVKNLSLSDWEKIFPLMNIQYIDFTNWYINRVANDSIRKLADWMNLPAKPVIEKVPFMEIESGSAEEEEEEVEPSLSLADIIEMLESARATSNVNADRAVYIYKQALSSLQDYVERQTKRLGRDWTTK